MRDGVSPEQPKVSVIMPVRDGERWVAEAIRSVQSQTFRDFELLVIDDGSADATPAILAEAAAADPRIFVLTQHRDGLVAGLNRGLAAARAPLIARLDADDIALPDRLARQVDYMTTHPAVVLLGGWATIVDENGQPKGRDMRPNPNDLRATLMKKSPFIHPTVMFRAEAARRVGGYHAAFEAGEDYDFWLRLADIGEVAILPELLIRYREHSASVTRTRQLRQIYSARLAKLAAAARQAGQPDPSAPLTTPPHWHDASPGPFERDSSRLFRMLELADPAVAARIAPSAIDLNAITSQLGTLTAGERKFAQAALLNLLRANKLPSLAARWSAVFLLVRLGPLKAIKAARQLRNR
ncbi:glycosyltransferase family 2 protein [Rhodopseudomonas palustris]|uniref:glycosyltransferase family 2 protein n=1 Tax=Rhodopseudomonas palustris TaxID=1076 RepID=UPI000CEBEF27|nr:glycosyltransferase [Rhodopseudomonas palustris]PPQ43390.1 glycosyl transferase [Rhodopseudomonas palustris]